MPGRHRPESVAVRRIELMEATVATLTESFDALKSKVEQAAAVHASKVGDLDPVIAKMDALTQYVSDNFLVDQPAAPLVDPAPVVNPAGAEQTVEIPPVDSGSGGWHPANP